ncbi:hypothetical protein E2C01_044762 [Portunus trituberculatus]|uniref:Uncharacterized protein n=1 Tax=Portunus trituberculatus TaxID=210409 RepID=A0A5B7G0D5_PORTR|nr:hypothetical protein [Portunus trituberculatus]
MPATDPYLFFQSISCSSAKKAATITHSAPTTHTPTAGADTIPTTRKPLPRVRKPNLHSDRGQDSEPVRLETPRTPKHAWFHCTTAD